MMTVEQAIDRLDQVIRTYNVKAEVEIRAHIERGRVVTDDMCTCPTCGSWYHAEDIDRMVKEISDALGRNATGPKLCDVVHEVVEMATARRRSIPLVTNGMVLVALHEYRGWSEGHERDAMRAALQAALEVEDA